MRVAVYVRVSTADQTTLNQEIELKGYCERLDYEVFKVYKDEGVSGSKTSRPALDEMLKDMRQGYFKAILVWKFDRLGRSVSHLLQVLEEMNNKGIRLIATSQNIDTDTPQGKLFFTMLSAFAEFERELITERIKLGIERKKKDGFKWGRPKGAKDKGGTRNKAGYWTRWAKKKV